MRNVQSVPFLRIILPFLTGIILFKLSGLSSPIPFIVIFIMGIVIALAYRRLSFDKKLRLFWINSAAIHFFLIALGYLSSYSHQIENKNNWYRKYTSSTSKLRAQITSPLKETDRTYKAFAKITKVYTTDTEISTAGNTILYFQKSDSIPQLSVGNEIIIANKLNSIISKGNPGEFDYGAFCRNKGIYDQAFLSSNEWAIVQSTSATFQNPFFIWHENIKHTLSQYVTHPEAKGIALALITGYRDDIDQEIYNAYTKTGLVHLLAISGLHMGIFYIGSQFLLSLLPFFKKRKRLLIIVALITMWVFALVTTFPPSVQRASIMFTFLGFGQLIYRKIPSLNFLFASAFLMLLFQPHLLWEVGFQLSYAAVIGILLFYKPLNKWLRPKNIVISKIWQIMCVSLAAQIFTLPLALYYFHQFPTLFLITNIIAIPAVTLIIYGEVMLILFSSFPPIAKIIGIAISYLIESLNSFIQFTSNISFVSIQNIYISLSQCVLFFGIILSFAVWLLAKRKVFVAVNLVLIITLFSISIYRKYNHLKQEKLIVYNATYPYMEYVNSLSSYSIDTIPSNTQFSFEKYTLQPSHLAQGIRNSIINKPKWYVNTHYDLVSQSNMTILRVKEVNKFKTKPLKVDYLIISDKWIKDPTALLSMVQPKELIIDGNIPMWKIQILKSQLREVNLPTHYVAAQGAKTIIL